MKKIKIISWFNFALLYIYACLLVAIIVFASINAEENPSSTNTIQILLLTCLGIIGIILVLGFTNLILCVKHSNEIIDGNMLKTSLKIKLGLIPFFVINFIFWGIFWLGTFNVFLILLAPIVWIVSIITTYLFFLVQGTPNVVFLVKKFSLTKEIIYLIYAILHFIYIVDIIGALFIYQKEKGLNPQNMSSTISK